MSDLQNDTFEYISLVAGNEKFASLGMDARWVADVKPLAGFRLAEKNNLVYGHLDWREQQVPVYRLDSILGRPESRLSREQRIMIINSQPAWGMLIEQEIPSLSQPADDITVAATALGLEQERVIEGIYPFEDNLVMLLEPTRLQRALFGRSSEPCWPAPGSTSSWQAVAMVERAEARVRAFMFMRSGLQLVMFKSIFGTANPPLFAFSLSQVIEVDTPNQILESPLFIPGLVGITTWRDWPIPVVDWEYLIGMNYSDRVDEEEKRLLICVSASGDFVGLLVGADVETIRLPRARYTDDAEGFFPDRIAGKYVYQDNQLILLDINRLIAPTIPSK